MKIQINNLEALERLIGDDKEMEIQVKSSIINEFAKKYIKSVAHSEIINDLKYTILKELKDEDYFGMVNHVNTSNGTVMYPTKKLKEAIKKGFDDIILQEITNAVHEAIIPIRKEVNDMIQKQINSIKDTVSIELSDDHISTIIQQSVNAKISSVFGKNKEN